MAREAAIRIPFYPVQILAMFMDFVAAAVESRFDFGANVL